MLIAGLVSQRLDRLVCKGLNAQPGSFAVEAHFSGPGQSHLNQYELTVWLDFQGDLRDGVEHCFVSSRRGLDIGSTLVAADPRCALSPTPPGYNEGDGDGSCDELGHGSGDGPQCS